MVKLSPEKKSYDIKNAHLISESSPVPKVIEEVSWASS